MIATRPVLLKEKLLRTGYSCFLACVDLLRLLSCHACAPISSGFALVVKDGKKIKLVLHMVAQLLPRLLTPGSRRPGRGTATRHLRRLADWVSYLARHGPPDRLIHYKYIHLHIYLLRPRRILGPMALAPHLKAFIKGIPDRRGERKDGQMQRKDPS